MVLPYSIRRYPSRISQRAKSACFSNNNFLPSFSELRCWTLDLCFQRLGDFSHHTLVKFVLFSVSHVAKLWFWQTLYLDFGSLDLSVFVFCLKMLYLAFSCCCLNSSFAHSDGTEGERERLCNIDCLWLEEGSPLSSFPSWRSSLTSSSISWWFSSVRERPLRLLLYASKRRNSLFLCLDDDEVSLGRISGLIQENTHENYSSIKKNRPGLCMATTKVES